MVGALRRWLERRRRLHLEAFDPSRAPHRPQVRALIAAGIPPLHTRLRRGHIDELVDRVLELERSPTPLLEQDPLEQRLLVVDRLRQVIAALEDEERGAHAGIANLGTLLAKTHDAGEARRLLAEYLRDAVTDPRALAEDLRALERWMGVDALRERAASRALRASALGELGLYAIEGLIAGLAGDDATALTAPARLAEAQLGPFLAARLEHASRWQVRLAAARALLQLAVVGGGAAIGDAVTAIAARATENPEEHAWVQGTALEVLVVADPGAGVRLARRVLGRPDDRRDFLVRKLGLGIAARRLGPAGIAGLVRAAIEARDPSEYVRLGLVDAAAAIGGDVALELLGILGAPDREPSPKVRAAAAIASQGLAAAATPEVLPAIAAEVGARLIAQIDVEREAFPLIVACEELAALAALLASRGPLGEAALHAAAPTWLAALARRVADPETPPRGAETAAASIEVIDRERDPARRALAERLAGVLETIPIGAGRGIPRATLPTVDATTLGRALAAITRRDWGVAARLGARTLTLWRGDRFRRRPWRVLQELRNPIPNKRQAWHHTVGRTAPGELRAPPGQLDEATATTVPGERVTVDAEGSWARHLPLVDDFLDAPVLRAGAPMRVYSSHGEATLTAPSTLSARVRAWWRLTTRYKAYAGLRLASLRATEPRERHRFLETIAAETGFETAFVPYPVAGLEPVAPVPPRVRSLFRDVPAAAVLPWVAVRDFLDAHRDYFLSATRNSQASLALFGTAITALFVARGYQKRRHVDRARESIPLSIGGWGTRGKSGTERLKAGLFDGMGFDVFVKTTGCEAMFIHSAPLQQPVEIFIYRPYDKATIWEQRAMVMLASRLGAEVFLWECMALNPRYVQLLQQDWMRDDLVTLTNCYPDHEDIQGPVGFNVAQVITEFIPKKSTLITSEQSYLPMFVDRCRERGTTMYSITERDAELIADDLLDLFPYREHPRNIALVTRVAEELGLERDFARVTMAANVVPDLGVLKAYPKVRVRGRWLTFVCGNSANERTGFINNWRRMKMDALDLEARPHELVVTVVNNRADRISRSEVFARILVRDVAFDRHVLIGTNLKGLRGFIEVALTDYLGELRLLDEADLATRDPAMPLERLARELGNLRLPPPTVRHLLIRLALYAGAAELTLTPDAEALLTPELERRLTADLEAPLGVDAVRAELGADAALSALLDRALVPATTPAPPDAWPEALEPPGIDDVKHHLVAELARLIVRSRLEARLRDVFVGAGGPSKERMVTFRAAYAAAYRELFLAQVHTVEDAGATGDQIIDFCARTVPPGSDVTLMGTQNIKGTGLDFVYRWLAMDKVVSCLAEQQSSRPDRRLAALAELEAFEDHGLVDTGHARALLQREPPQAPTPLEVAARARIKAKVDAVWTKRKAGLAAAKKTGALDLIAARLEGVLDYLDSVRRSRSAERVSDDLVARRISHQRASLELRGIVGRIKGGWLIKALRAAGARKP